MVSNNTETGITVTYDTSNDNLDFAINAAQTGINSILATDLIVGEDAETAIDFGTVNEIDFKAANAVQLTLSDGVFRPQTDSDVDLGTSSLFFKDAFIDKITTTGDIELGHATDTTIARASAGQITVEGVAVLLAGAQTGITTDFNAGRKVGRDAHNLIDFSTDDKVTFRVANVDEIALEANEFSPTTNDGIALGSAAKGWSDLFLADGGAIKFGDDQDITLTHTADTGLTLESAASTMPLFTIKNTTNDANGARLRFVKDKNAAGADGDDIGVIEFIGDDTAQTQTSFAKIVAEVSEADDAEESGKLSLFVAESDGSTTALTQGLILEGAKNQDGRVDATIANGAASLSRVNGNLMVNTSISLLEPVGTGGAFVRFAKFLAGVNDNTAVTFANISAPNANQAAMIRVKVHCSNGDGSRQSFRERDFFIGRASGAEMSATPKTAPGEIDGAAALGTIDLEVSTVSGANSATQTRTLSVKCDSDNIDGMNFLVEVEVYTTVGSVAVTPA
mgnify:CR=1 FL=1